MILLDEVFLEVKRQLYYFLSHRKGLKYYAPKEYRYLQNIIKLKHEINADVIFESLEEHLAKNQIVVSLSLPKITIQLASKTAEYSPDIAEKKFIDGEDKQAIYRLKWLVYQIGKLEDKNIFATIILQMLKPSKEIIHAYSLSERLSNLLHILETCKLEFDAESLRNISIEIYNNFSHLCETIEYFGPFTNNHILNNSRALYRVGLLTQNRQILDASTDIIYTFLDKFMNEGSFSEGSSHYQSLITSFILDIYHHASSSNDEKLKSFLEPKVSSMLGHCNINYTKRGGSLFAGDLSPDSPPDFFSGYPFSKKNSISRWNICYPKHNVPKSTLAKKTSYVHSFEYKDFELFFILKKSARLPHAHEDNGNIILFYKGNEILIDLGRENYLDSSQQFIQKTSHNIIQGSDLFFEANQTSSCRSQKYSAKSSYSINVNVVELTIKSFIGKPTWKRTITFYDKSFSISDSILNSQPLKLHQNFHFTELHTKIKIDLENDIEKQDIQYDLVQRSIQYGQKKDAWRIKVAFSNQSIVNFDLSQIN